jgi:cellulose synthase/poly-beta-1,6-N-acetylglucosamine synthase-like glycosyltransferase
MEIAFWLVLLIILYTLTGYPVLLSFLASLKKEKTYPPAKSRPIISCIVAAYNEENNIAAKIENLIQIDYDPDKIEFIIGSDASTDGTDHIITAAAGKDARVKYFRLERRGGKIAVLRQAVQQATGSILIFTDCSVRTPATIMPAILSSFEDTAVGMVSSRDIWTDAGSASPTGQNQYIGYEMKIRRWESRLNSLVSASGSFCAVRKELFQPYASDLADDFALPLSVYRQGYKVIHRDDLAVTIPMVKSSGAELARRTRIVEAGIRTVLANRALLNPCRYPLFAWQLWSHKVLKWFFPFMVLIHIVIALRLWPVAVIYQLATVAYAILAVLGIAGLAIGTRSPATRPLRMAAFVIISILAVLKAWCRVIFGVRTKSWEPTHR